MGLTNRCESHGQKWLRVVAIFQGLSTCPPLIIWLMFLYVGFPLSEPIIWIIYFFIPLLGLFPLMGIMVVWIQCWTDYISEGRMFIYEMVKSSLVTIAYLWLLYVTKAEILWPYNLVYGLVLVVLFYPTLFYSYITWQIARQDARFASNEDHGSPAYEGRHSHRVATLESGSQREVGRTPEESLRAAALTAEASYVAAVAKSTERSPLLGGKAA